ncbi:MAG: MCP four helix bundle domain-containing protein [Nitrospirota bacterium]
MKWLGDLKISVKLLSGFILVASFVAILGVVGIMKLKAMDDANTVMYEVNTAPLSQISDVAIAFQRTRVNLRNMILSGSDAENAKNAATIKDLDVKVNTGLAEFEKTIKSDDVRKDFSDLKDAVVKYEPIKERIISLTAAHKNAEASSLLQDSGTAVIARTVDEKIQNMMDLKVRTAKERLDANTTAVKSAIGVMTILIAAGVLLALALGIFISRIISVPLKKSVELANALALGDTSQRIDVERKDEVGQLASAMNTMAENFQASASVAEKVASGDLSAKVNVLSDKDVLGKSLNSMVATLNEVVAETKGLTKASVEGRLDTRGDAAKFGGGFKEIVSGINETLDAVIVLGLAAGEDTAGEGAAQYGQNAHVRA